LLKNNNMSCDSILSLIDWRFEMAALYQRVSSSESLNDIWPSFTAERKRLYQTHKQSPLQRGKSIAFFDYDPAFSFEVSLRPLSAINSQTVDGGKDGLIHLNAVAITSGLAPSLGVELTIYQLAHYGGGLFLPFRDDTNGDLSYGGGRYLIDTAKSAWLGFKSDRLRLDFNFSYFPSCAHNNTYVCPLSPPENRLPIAIKAGERWEPNDPR
jgi:uncharacterized protein (DUF1684 family)